jgi:C-terminal processing protease CtpA/Prc
MILPFRFRAANYWLDLPILILAAGGYFWFAAQSFEARGAESAASKSTTPSNTPPAVILDALCTALRSNYPMLEMAGWQEEWPQEFRTRIEAAATRQAAFELMDELVCRLNDYHTRFFWPNKRQLVSAPFRVEPLLASGVEPLDHSIWGRLRPPIELPALDNIAIAVTVADEKCGLAAGDEILSVNGVPVQTALAEAWRHSVCSSEAGKLRGAANRMLQVLPEAEGELKLVVRRRTAETGEETVTVSLKPSRGPAENTISSREVEGVPVIRITRWGNNGSEKLAVRFDELLGQFRERPAIIIDVRGNGGGQDDLAGQVAARFLKNPIIASISFHRQVPALTFERTVEKVSPRGPWRYEGRVAVLIDEGCMSACEHFVSAMAEAGALLCGTPTSGACGWIRPVELPDGLRVNVSQTFPLHTGGIPSQQLGIAPHLWAPRKLTDLRAGQDTALQAALLWIKSTDPLPVRFQPITTISR